MNQQVPQFLLEEWESGVDGSSDAFKCIITQPRRIAATGVATRVASERRQQHCLTVNAVHC
jgi:HrpA-like RNA helicase